MIYGNIHNSDSLKDVSPIAMEAIEYALNNDILHQECGQHVVDDQRFFYNVVNYQTTTVDKRFWEAHRKYLDVHVILQGDEKINVNLLDQMKIDGYDEKDDYVQVSGDAKLSLDLKVGDFLILNPQDAHMTALMVDNQSSDVKKVIFKVLI